MDKQSLVKVLGGSAVAFGLLAVAAPDALLKAYRFDPNPEVRGMTRLWGTRNVLIGVLALQAKGRQLDDLLGAAAVMNSVDAVVSFGGNALDGTKGPGGALAGATSAFYAALGFYIRRL